MSENVVFSDDCVTVSACSADCQPDPSLFYDFSITKQITYFFCFPSKSFHLHCDASLPIVCPPDSQVTVGVGCGVWTACKSWVGQRLGSDVREERVKERPTTPKQYIKIDTAPGWKARISVADNNQIYAINKCSINIGKQSTIHYYED